MTVICVFAKAQIADGRHRDLLFFDFSKQLAKPRCRDSALLIPPHLFCFGRPVQKPETIGILLLLEPQAMAKPHPPTF